VFFVRKKERAGIVVIPTEEALREAWGRVRHPIRMGQKPRSYREWVGTRFSRRIPPEGGT